jgi:tRNA-specific 2-thiouridylase
MSKKVYVGMSGGVDSSVTAALLLQSGYHVTGVFMKNWTKDLPGYYCSWQEDYRDAKRVAVQLGIPFKIYDFENDYRHKVVDYMIDEYRSGRTPNPDIMCNQEIKFKLFLERALRDGADLIATGHYARVKEGSLYVGVDKNKDQSYFLYRITEQALKRTLMPVGEFTKPEIRSIAKKLKLATADKKDSQGICFIGEVDIKDFLLSELGPQPNGVIIDQNGKKVGQHEGAILYTIGQRHGLNVGGGLPYYVVGKDIKDNIIYVTTDLQDKKLWDSTIKLTDVHWINHLPLEGLKYSIRTRYRAPLVKVNRVTKRTANNWQIELDDEVRAVTPGQSAVIYLDDQVVGGGIVI